MFKIHNLVPHTGSVVQQIIAALVFVVTAADTHGGQTTGTLKCQSTECRLCPIASEKSWKDFD